MSERSPYSFPSYLSDLIAEIEFLGSVPPNNKISLYWRSYLPTENWSTQPFRWATGENAKVICEHFQKIINDLLQIMEDLFRKESSLHQIMIEKAIHLRQGIVNTIQTYENCKNPDAVSKLKAILSVLEYQLPTLSEKE